MHRLQPRDAHQDAPRYPAVAAVLQQLVADCPKRLVLQRPGQSLAAYALLVARHRGTVLPGLAPAAARYGIHAHEQAQHAPRGSGPCRGICPCHDGALQPCRRPQPRVLRHRHPRVLAAAGCLDGLYPRSRPGAGASRSSFGAQSPGRRRQARQERRGQAWREGRRISRDRPGTAERPRALLVLARIHRCVGPRGSGWPCRHGRAHQRLHRVPVSRRHAAVLDPHTHGHRGLRAAPGNGCPRAVRRAARMGWQALVQHLPVALSPAVAHEPGRQHQRYTVVAVHFAGAVGGRRGRMLISLYRDAV